MASTIAPVPSGEPSSTTNTSSEGSCARIAGTIRAMLNRSLYVGTMTSARSGKASPVVPDSCTQHQKSEGYRKPGDHFPPLVSGAREIELDAAPARRQLDTNHRVVCSPDSGRFSVDGCDPARVVVLRDDK